VLVLQLEEAADAMERRLLANWQSVRTWSQIKTWLRAEKIEYSPMHPFNYRVLAEDLVRVRRPDERGRYAGAQRQARIDPNPHQIDAVIFALRRLREGGCILADEVGLGKTIEAGLVIAQSRAEGAQRILLIVPKSLIGQWQNELLNLFGIQARENETNFFAPGVYLVGREFAGSERGATALGAAPPFDKLLPTFGAEWPERLTITTKWRRIDHGGIDDLKEWCDSAKAPAMVLIESSPKWSPPIPGTSSFMRPITRPWGCSRRLQPSGALLGSSSTMIGKWRLKIPSIPSAAPTE
jgi:hypothetical protein